MNVREKYSYEKVYQIDRDLLDERSEWDVEAKQISSFLLPGRGIFQNYTKPRKRKLTTNNVINTVAEDSLTVLTSGLHGRLTSPASPWFRASWNDKRLNSVEPLKMYMQESVNLLHEALHASNFYSIINSFYTEYAGYGNGCIYVGEDSYLDDVPFNFQLLTFGEYAFALGADGKLDVFTRHIFMSERQLVDMFPSTVSDEVKRRVSENQAGIDKINVTVIEFVARDKGYMDKNYVRLMYQSHGVGNAGNNTTRSVIKNRKPLLVDGFYECPYHVGRWDIIGSDTYGIGPGSRSLQDIKRLQEMEKSFLMATHKSINPPLNAPARMKGKLNTLPGGQNYYSNPQEIVTSMYATNFDFTAVMGAVERVEQRIQRNFFNDVFLMASRDPNASPLKAAQVHSQDQEKTFRLGPVVDRLFNEIFEPTIRRCFQIMRRKGRLPELPPELEELAGDFTIDLISPMAVAQRMVKSQGTDALMGFVGQAAQFDPNILDNINPDIAVRQRAEIEGVDIGVLRSEQEVADLREQRAKAQQAEQAKQEAMQQAGMQSQLNSEDVANRKTLAETGQILSETQATSLQSGLQ